MLAGPDPNGVFTARVDFTDNTRAEVKGGDGLSPGFHHVAMTWDGSTLILYVDGKPVANQSEGPKTIYYYNSGIVIGYNPMYPFGYYDGVIDEVAFYNVVLAPSTINSIFDAGSAGKCKVNNLG